jgi:hypothetical protein
MKQLLTILLLFTLTAHSQVIRRDMVKPIVFRSTLMVMSGFCDGTSEVLKIKYDRFDRVWHCNDQFWDYNISWHNKYKNGIAPDPAFLFSKNALVWTTDGYHLMRMMRNCTMIASVTIPIGKHKPRKWYSYVAESAIYYVAYTTGFNLAYDVVYK